MSYQEVIQQLLDHSKQMLSDSQQGEWENVGDLENQRQDLLKQLENIPAQANDLDMAKLLHEIIDINKEIELLSRHEMDRCREEYSEFQNKKSAINAYSSF